ncbi:dephospho-CoA kinase [Lacticigenium naphthae]|uniref:dephospho-CoA kinase n=1 Tax=Lacticigenium naphthae TaxID=515351 RepID=UPI00040D3198|nr:dephospho-CoA kinase [Lacticigenium naphthae]
MTFVLGLTGGISTGKSFVASLFASYGIPVIDADEIARRVVEPGTKGLESIVKHFGKDILTCEGTLDRKKLGSIIFDSSTERNVLDDLLSLEIRRNIIQEIEKKKRMGYDLIIADIPLLFEASYEKLVDKVMVVAIEENEQLQRLMNRDSLSEEEAKNRIKAQMNLSEKINRADFVIWNDRSKQETKEKLGQWMKDYGFLNK